MHFLPEHYLEASTERIESARRLYADQSFSLAIYLAGVAVECILRAYRIREDRQFDSRHNLQELLKLSGMADFVPEDRSSEFGQHFGQVWSRWKNDYRYASEDRLRTEYKRLKLDRAIKGDHLKENARVVVESALTIVTIGAKRWNSKKN